MKTKRKTVDAFSQLQTTSLTTALACPKAVIHVSCHMLQFKPKMG